MGGGARKQRLNLKGIYGETKKAYFGETEMRMSFGGNEGLIFIIIKKQHNFQTRSRLFMAPNKQHEYITIDIHSIT
jgi:hypothetical protein